jgi:hypothetical protein
LSQAVVETSAAGVAPMFGSSSQASTITTNQAKGNFVSISSCCYFILIYWLLLLQGKQCLTFCTVL